MSVRIPKIEFNKRDIEKIKDDCFVIGNKGDYGPPPTVECWLETTNSIFVPFAYAKTLNKKTNYTWPRTNYKFLGNFKSDKQKVVFEEAVEMFNKKDSCFLALHCGFGKTWEGIKLAHHQGYKTAVLAHRTILIDQWIESIRKFTTAKVQVVDTNGILNPDADFYIFNTAYVSKTWSKEKKKWVPRIVGSYKNIGMLIVDEAHIACAAEMSKAFMYFQPKVVLSLTATPRTDGLDKVLDLHFGEEKIVRIAQDPFLVYRLPTGIKPEFTTNKMGKKDWTSVITYLSNHKERNELIVKLAKKFQNNTILILTKRTEQCTILTNLLKMNNQYVTSMKGNDTTYDKQARILVSTFSKSGVGFDDVRFNMFIVACDVGEIEQYAGRLRYTDGIERTIIDLVDDDGNCQDHWLNRRKWYLSRNGDIKNYYSVFPNEKPLKVLADTSQVEHKRLATKKKN